MKTKNITRILDPGSCLLSRARPVKGIYTCTRVQRLLYGAVGQLIANV